MPTAALRRALLALLLGAARPLPSAPPAPPPWWELTGAEGSRTGDGANVERFGPSVLLDRDERASSGRRATQATVEQDGATRAIDDFGELVFEVPEAPPRPYTCARHRHNPTFTAMRVSPRAADAAGNITVLVTGTSFDDFGDVSCRFGVAAVPAHLHHHGALTCIVPPLSAAIPTTEHYPTHLSTISLPSLVPLTITLNGVDYNPHSLEFYYFNKSRVSVAALHPSGGPAAGGTLVNVSGANFVDHSGGVASSGPKCKFGRVVVPATILSLDQARCRAPPRPPGAGERVHVRLTINGYTDARGIATGAAPMMFRYAAPHTIASIEPLGGPSRGGSWVTVRGSGFEDDGRVTTPCAADDEFTCTMHNRSVEERFAPLQVGWNRNVDLGDPRPLGHRYSLAHGADHSHRIEPVGMQWHDDPTVYDADPSYRALVDPRNSMPPPAGLHCLFGDPPIAVAGSLVEGGGAVRCLSPPAEAIQGLAPPGKWCDVLGYHHCDDPAYAAAGVLAAPLRITLNGNASDAGPPRAGAAVAPWLLMPDGLPRVLQVTPRGGPYSGGTNVTVVGDGLLDLGRPTCRFGGVDVPAIIGGVEDDAIEEAPLVSRAEVFSGRRNPVVDVSAGRLLRCTAPPLNTTPSAAMRDVWGDQAYNRHARLSVSLDGVHFTGVYLEYRYVPNVTVSAMLPRGGPAAGGTAVTLFGKGFDDVGGKRCLFGGVSAPASMIGFRMLRCITPPAEAMANRHLFAMATTPIVLTLNGVEHENELMATNKTFTYYPPAGFAVSRIEPSWGPFAGGTMVRVYGSGFRRLGHVKCRFGNKLPVDSYELNAADPNRRVQSTEAAPPPPSPPPSPPPRDGGGHDNEGWLDCAAPPHDFGSSVRGTESMALEVSLGDPFHYTASNVTFTYHASCEGRDTLEFWEAQPPEVWTAVRRYITFNYPDVYRSYDLNGDGAFTADELEYAFNQTRDGVMPEVDIEHALKMYAAQSCYDPAEGRAPMSGSIWDDTPERREYMRTTTDAWFGLSENTVPYIGPTGIGKHSFGSMNDDEQWSPKYRLDPDLSGIADVNWRRLYGSHRPEELDTEVVETDWSGATGPPYGARYHRPDTPGWDRDDRASHEPDRGWDLYENHGLPLGMPT